MRITKTFIGMIALCFSVACLGNDSIVAIEKDAIRFPKTAKKVYHDFEGYNDSTKLAWHDTAFDAQVLSDNTFYLDGSIDVTENIVDVDWYRLTINQRSNYQIKFISDGDISLSLIKYGTPNDRPIIYLMDDGNTEEVLMPGTYFICVQPYNTDFYYNSEYYIETQCNYVYEYLDCQLNEENLDNFGFAYWQNDLSLYSNETKHDVFETNSYYFDLNFNSLNGLFTPFSVDPFYLEKTDDIHILHNPENIQIPFTDSELYIWDKQLMIQLADAFKNFGNAIRNNYVSYLKSIKTEDNFETIGDIVYFVSDKFLTKIPLFGTYVDCVLGAVDVCSLFSSCVNVYFDSTSGVINLFDLSRDLSWIEGFLRGVSQTHNNNDIVKISRISSIESERNTGLYKYVRNCLVESVCVLDEGIITIPAHNHFDPIDNKYHSGKIKLFRKAHQNIQNEEGIEIHKVIYNLDKTPVCIDSSMHKIVFQNGYTLNEKHTIEFCDDSEYHCKDCSFNGELKDRIIKKINLINLSSENLNEIKHTEKSLNAENTASLFSKNCRLVETSARKTFFMFAPPASKNNCSYIEILFTVPVMKVEFEMGIYQKRTNTLKHSVLCDILGPNDELDEWNHDLYIKPSDMNLTSNPKKYTLENGNYLIKGIKISVISTNDLINDETICKSFFSLDNMKITCLE